jgi:hypothetical protein
MNQPTARYYDPDKNPDGGALPGVPLRDLTTDEFEHYPQWLQRSIDAAPMYRKTPIRPSVSSAASKAAPTPAKED